MARAQNTLGTAFLLITSASPDLLKLSASLREFAEVRETAILYGQYDVVAILREVDEGRAQEIAGQVALWPQVNFALVEVAEDGAGFQRPAAGGKGTAPTEAFVEMTVDSLQRASVLQQLHAIGEVVEARPVGDNRVLCWLYGASKTAIDRAMMEKLRGVQGVFATSSYLAVGEPTSAYRWSRPA